MTRTEILELYLSQIEPHEVANANHPKYAEFMAFEEGLSIEEFIDEQPE